MRENRLRTLLNEGKPTFGTRLQSAWPTATELVGRSGQFDYVEFLAEYAPYDLHALDNMGRAIELSPNFTGLIKMERSAQWHLAVRAMSAGIQNLLFTDVRTAADAEECVRLVRPEGPDNDFTHGMAGGRIQVEGGADYLKYYNDAVIVLMVEKRGAVENLEAILSVPGVDMVQFGPADYGMSIGKPGRSYAGGLHPEVIEAREYTARTAIKMGVRPRAEINTASEAEYYLKLGVKDFCLSTDVSILRSFYRQEGGALRELVAQSGVSEDKVRAGV
ncbi:MAG: 2,4-dihydroxyhept-2-ene-1,7-dioic acid aldolase [Chloroflexi bacterium]|nr:2,4-dihydroxyhept-2-ene-1,7-dioic acid aldolase [Chloroflexota bacterium]